MLDDGTSVGHGFMPLMFPSHLYDVFDIKLCGFWITMIVLDLKTHIGFREMKNIPNNYKLIAEGANEDNGTSTSSSNSTQ